MFIPDHDPRVSLFIFRRTQQAPTRDPAICLTKQVAEPGRLVNRNSHFRHRFPQGLDFGWVITANSRSIQTFSNHEEEEFLNTDCQIHPLANGASGVGPPEKRFAFHWIFYKEPGRDVSALDISLQSSLTG